MEKDVHEKPPSDKSELKSAKISRRDAFATFNLRVPVRRGESASPVKYIALLTIFAGRTLNKFYKLFPEEPHYWNGLLIPKP
ncbi:hypothetical protein MASR2M39_19670 [Ignavibacteriales bacterium]